MPTLTVGNQRNNLKGENGFTYVLVLVALMITGIMAGNASQSAYMVLQKDRESQLIFAGMAYYNAIRQFHQANGYYPRSLKDLIKDPNSAYRIHLRQLYHDPMKSGEGLSGEAGWRLLRAADGGISGVASRSKKEPLKKTNFPLGFENFENSSTYSDWEFEYSLNPQRNISSINKNISTSSQLTP